MRSEDTNHLSAGKGNNSPSSFQTTSPTIELPKGGGAIRGIGEKFAANPVTGTGSMSVPIATSPGRSGFGPQLSLSYDSGAGNGPFGFGWNLALPSITRKTDKGLPQYFDAEESDVFILSGAEDLVPVLIPNEQGEWGRENSPERIVDGVTYKVQLYRPRIEGLFARIECWTNTTDAKEIYWRSISGDNITTWYGRTATSRIADPIDPTRIFSWLICQSHDDKGNVLIYDYKREDSERIFEDIFGNLRSRAHERNRSDVSRSAQRYLKCIRYGNRSPYFPALKENGPWPEPPDAHAIDGSNSWHFEVVFDYGEHDAKAPKPTDAGIWPARSDPFSTYRAGFEVRTYRLCRRALMFHHFPGEADVERHCLVRSTDFTYSDEVVPTDVRNPIYTFLHAVTQIGYRRTNAGYDQRSLPPVEFEYTEPVVQDMVEEVDSESLENLPVGLDGSIFRWTDLHGEGIPGILTEQAGAWYYKRNLSPIPEKLPDGREQVGVKFAPLEVVALKPNIALSGGAEFMDLAGDGHPDVVVMDGPTPGLYEHDEAEGWQSFRPFTSRLNRDLRDPNLRFVDLDGDGHADVMITEDDAIVWHASLAEDGFGPARRVAQALDEEKGPRIVFADGTQSIYLADFSGDGLNDIVRICKSEVCYWPNLGYGHFGSKVTMDNAPWFDHLDQFDQKRIRLADIDGSGTTDIIYLHGEGVRLYFNQSGNSWSQHQLLKVFPRVDDLVNIIPADLLGNGTACLVWSSPLPGDSRQPMRYVNLMGEHKPHLLVKAINNMGVETRVDYAPSTKFYLQDKRDGKPWVTRLPFPVHVVELIESSDLVSDTRLVNTYRYRHGFFDYVEREFRGFAYVEQHDVETLTGEFDLPPIVTKTWFHTGVFLEGSKLETYFKDPINKEYFTGDTQAIFLPDTELPPDLSVDEMREAARALKGSILRQEVYSDDGTSKAEQPYSVSERSYKLSCLQPQGPNRHAVFFSHSGETIDYHYERNPADPRTSHALTLEIDDYGNVLKSVAIGYPRRTPAFDEQKKTLAKLTESQATNAVLEADAYRIPLLVETSTYELTAPTLKGAKLLHLASVAQIVAVASEIAYEFQPTLGQAQKRLIEQVRNLYRKNDLSALLPTGKIESMALPGESYKMALTPGLLDVLQVKASRSDLISIITGPEGQYRNLDDNGLYWIPSGRVFYSPTSGDLAQQELPFALTHFFLPHRFQDPFGNTTMVAYDSKYSLLPVSTRDAVGNETVADQDYRVLRPRMVTDPNGNRAEARFDALGMLAGTAMRGKAAGAVEGDSFDDFIADLKPAQIKAFFGAVDPHALAVAHLGSATTRIVYDLERVPACAASIARETHVSALAQGQPSKILLHFVYSDGYGREAQTKVQAEPGPLDLNDSNSPMLDPRWVGTGTNVYNNKGKPVRQYEPFFSPTSGFGIEKQGVSSTLFYDPVERVVATLHPNNTFDKVVFDPWQQTTWDVNDTVTFNPITDTDVSEFFSRLPDGEYLPTWHQQRVNGGKGPDEKVAADKAAKHSDTPTLAHFDTLGRTFLTIADNGKDTSGNDQKYLTRTTLDIEGYQREVIDTLGRVVMRYDYDMLGTRIHQASMEAGERWILNDVTGNSIRAWNSRKYTFQTEYDALRRPLRSFVQGGDPSESNPKVLTQNIVFERTIYGDSADTGLTNLQRKQANLHGKVFSHSDGAGVVTTDQYDFKGNPLRGSRQFVADYKKSPDWSKSPAFESETFSSSTVYDALNRAIAITAPDNSIYRSAFNEANLLDKVDVNLRAAQQNGKPVWTQFVSNIDYNAKGQRTLIGYANGAQTTYEYDEETFRLIHVNTTRTLSPGAPGAGPSDVASQIFNGAIIVQDLRYTYDPAGNISRIEDAALQTVHHDSQQIDPVSNYTYDALYRLIKATGREHIGQSAFQFVPPNSNYRDYPFVGAGNANDLHALRNYTEQYGYDPVGNVNHMIHQAANGNWTRTYTYNENSLNEVAKKSNRLSQTALQTSAGSRVEPYHYDAHGHMTQMPHLPLMQWCFKDQMSVSSRQVVNVGSPETSFYVYDAGGQRTRKVTERQNGTRKNERFYIGGFEIYREYGGDGTTLALARETLYVMDDKQRIALVETKTFDEGSAINTPAPTRRYLLSNHLGSASLELDDVGGLISYEEYSPYGSTAYQTGRSATEVSLKRYRYTGKERDEETGFTYHGARYGAGWLGRWVSCDPAPNNRERCLYEYVLSNPLRFHDPDGRREEEAANAGVAIASGAGAAVGGLLQELFEAVDSNLNAAARNRTKQEPKEHVNIPLAVAKEAAASGYELATKAPVKVAIQAGRTWRDEFVAAVVTPNANEATAHGVKAVGAAVRFTAASILAYEAAKKKVPPDSPAHMAPDAETPPGSSAPTTPAASPETPTAPKPPEPPQPPEPVGGAPAPNSGSDLETDAPPPSSDEEDLGPNPNRGIDKSMDMEDAVKQAQKNRESLNDPDFELRSRPKQVKIFSRGKDKGDVQNELDEYKRRGRDDL